MLTYCNSKFSYKKLRCDKADRKSCYSDFCVAVQRFELIFFFLLFNCICLPLLMVNKVDHSDHSVAERAIIGTYCPWIGARHPVVEARGRRTGRRGTSCRHHALRGWPLRHAVAASSLRPSRRLQATAGEMRASTTAKHG